MVFRCGWWGGAACLFVSALAQTGSQEPVLRITVNLIQVDAVVTDSSGHQVTNLKVDDFEVLEDGRLQKITAFSYVNVGAPRPERIERAPAQSVKLPPVAPPATTNLAKQQVQRTIVLMVDDLSLAFESVARVRTALRKFVDEQMQEGDLVAVIRTRNGIGSLQQFTNNKQILRDAIDRIRWFQGGGISASVFTPLGSQSLSNASQMNMGGRGNNVARNVDRYHTASFASGTLASINFVIGALRELPGRKALILFSDGIPSAHVADGLRGLVDQANRSAVVLYTIDTRALQNFALNATDATIDPKYNNPATLAGAVKDRGEDR